MKWYAVHVIMFFKVKRGKQQVFPVWENIYLVNAKGPAQAKRRGEALGRAEEEDGLTWEGKPVTMVFGGIRKVMSCAADPTRPGPSDVKKLYDGVEATFNAYAVASRKDLNALIAGKNARVVYEE